MGPAIASGSQVCDSSCADFPIAPIRISIQITFHPSGWTEALLKAEAKSKLPTFLHIQNIVVNSPISPIRLTIIALIAHLLLSDPVNQNLISK